MKNSKNALILVFLEITFLISTFLLYYWLKTILVGIFFIIIIVCFTSGIMGLILSIIYLLKVNNIRFFKAVTKIFRKFKKKFFKERINEKSMKNG